VVGQGESASGVEAFRWTTAGMLGLGDLTGGSFSSNAYGVSSNGSVVVGAGVSATSNEAFRWTSGTGMVGLGDLTGGGFQSIAEDVSSDGSVVVGWGTSALGREAFRWTSGTGMVALGDLAGGIFESRAAAVSSDGSVVVGRGFSASGGEAFRWTSATGMVGLGDLPGDSFDSFARGVSADGSVIVGEGRSSAGIQAFRWTSGTGMVGLGDLAGGSFNSRALEVSADGSIVVGYGFSALGQEASLWTSDAGMQSLTSLLSTYGISVTGFSRLVQSNDVAVNGNITTIVGYGNSTLGPRAFRSTLPIVSASLADELLSLTPGLTSDTLALDVSNSKLLYGDVSRYEFDFTTDGIYDLVLDVGTPLFDSYWDAMSQCFLFPELDVRSYYPAINAGSFSSLSFNTRIRMTHENGTAINTSDAVITVVPEVGSLIMMSMASSLIILGALRHRHKNKVCRSFT
jgi:probable HAF family extracellular repeat protein